MNGLVNYLEKELELSEIEKIKLKYSIDIIFADISKILILLSISAFLGKSKEYAYSVLALLTIRPFTGGMHFKTYTGCLIFTGLFFSASIFLHNTIPLNILAPFLFVISFIIILTLAPIISENRPSYSYNKKLKFRVFALLVISTHYLAYIMISNNSYLSISIWIILLQSIQLLLKKGADLFENYKKYHKSIS